MFDLGAYSIFHLLAVALNREWRLFGISKIQGKDINLM